MKKIYFTILILLTATSAFAQMADSLFNAANQAYSNGSYDEAAKLYEDILKQDKTSAILYYNLGNAYFKKNELGLSILNYERASSLAPADEDIEHNLELARLQVVDKFDNAPEFVGASIFKKIKSMFSANTWGAIALTLFAVVLILILTFLFAPSLSTRKWAFWIACVVLLLSIGCKFIESSLRSVNYAIVMQPVVTVKSSPDENGKDLFLLHEGSKITVRDKLNSWKKIQLPNGDQGWVISETVTSI